MKIERFEDLEIWQDYRDLCQLIFKITSVMPFCDDFRFRDQIRCAGSSVMDNVAEGFGRGGNREFVNFLRIAKGSNDEVGSQLNRAFDFNYITDQVLNDLLERTDKISRKISNFIGYLKSTTFKGHKFR